MTGKNSETSNPFAGYGKTIQSDRIVGRIALIELLTKRLQSHAGNLSLVGQPRIGKSTVVLEAQRRVQDASPEVPIVYLNVGAINNSLQLFDSVIEDILEHVEDLRLVEKSIINEIRSYPRSDEYEAFRRCRRGLKRLKSQGIRSVLILDDFDGIRSLPSANVAIQRIRDLLYRPHEFGLCGIIISRRPLSTIEMMVNDVSVLFGICERQYLKPLSKDEMDGFKRRCACRWTWTQDHSEDLWWQTGGHPFLAEMILCHAWETGDLANGVEQVQSQIYDYCELLRRQLSDDGLFDQLLQWSTGPLWNVKPGSRERLLQYGLMVPVQIGDDVSYRGWSEHFQLFLQKCNRESPIWFEWRDTEKALRAVIDDTLTQRFGDQWVAAISDEDKEIATVLEACSQQMLKERRVFGPTDSEMILDFAYTSDLWMILSRQWNIFRPIFGNRPKKYWAERFELLKSVRNRTAHHRDSVVTDRDLNLARAYCQEMSSAIKSSYSHSTEMKCND